MGIAGGFPRHRPEAEALGGVETGRLQPVIVKGERFGLAVFQEKFPVVGARQGGIQLVLDAGAVHAGAGKEQIGIGHDALRLRRTGKKPANANA